MNELYPELVDYIYDYCSTFRTKEESLAKLTAIYTSKNASPQLHNMMVKKGWISEDPAILEMLADGYDAFKNRLAHRIWNRHQHELSLNLCPRCGKIARTPQARQCRFCFYSWHLVNQKK